jgi:ABC-type amino acid transport substrate-binding protein
VGLRVGVLKGSGGAALVDAYNLYKSKGVRLFTAASAEDLIDRLVKQQLDSVVLDTPLAQWLAPRAKLKVAQPVFLPVSYVGVVQAGNQELKIALDQGLQQLAQTSTLEMICRKWNLWNDLQMQLRRPS